VVKPPPWQQSAQPRGRPIQVVVLNSNGNPIGQKQTSSFTKVSEDKKTKIHIKIQTSENKVTTMKKDRKKQEDRLLKHLSLRERQRQLQLRAQIAQDPLFLVV
jgi:hypothetical protein